MIFDCHCNLSENLIKVVKYGKERDQELTEPHLHRATILQTKNNFEWFGLTLLKHAFYAEPYKHFLPKTPHQHT